MKRGTLLPAVAAVAALAVPTTASAATSIDLGGGSLAITGDAFRNDIEVRRVADGYVIRDSAANLSIVAGSDCFFSDPPREVRCRTGSEVDVSIDGRAAADELTVIGGSRRANLDGGDGTDRLVGGPGPDRLIGGPNGDTLLGNSGNDVLVGEAGPDSLQGGAGVDTVSYAERSAGVTITLAVDAFDERADDGNIVDGPAAGARDAIDEDVENAIGGGGDDSILGNNVRNGLQGRGGADVVTGRSGDDVLEGGLGPDILNGNDGVDLAVYDDHVQPLALSLDNVANDGNIAEDGILQSPANAGKVDNIRADVEGVIGGAGPDIITGNAGANRLDGGDGDDSLSGAAGDDDLNGGAGEETFVAEPGADDVSGGPGRDAMSYEPRALAVTVSLDGVADDGTTGAERDNVRPDVETVTATREDDVLLGGDGDDRLDGATGEDRLDGRGGNDDLEGGTSTDIVVGGDGIDVATYSHGPVTVTLDGVANDGNQGNALRGIAPEADNVLTEGVSGSGGNDVLVGNAGANRLEGGAGDDTVRGGDDRDVLDGGAGIDTLLGEGGPDAVDANDGVRDAIDCGADLDLLSADLADTNGPARAGIIPLAGIGCESQFIAPAGRLPNVALAAKVVRVARERARVKLRCPRASHVRCKGTLRLQRLDGTDLARGRFAIRKGRRAALTLRLRRSVRSGPVRVVARQRDTDGRPKLTVARARARQP
jgi:Ca2+-binding RTX toxin-like protein